MSGYGWDGAASIADLDPTPDELADLADVLAEVGDDGLDDGDDDGSAQLAAISEAIELSNARRLAREREDGQPVPRRSEDRIAHLLKRVEHGTYTELAQADDGAHGCGPLDEFGRCSSPFHSGYCYETFRGESATGSAQAAEAWRSTLLGNQQAAIELANAQAELDAEVDEALAGPNDLASYHAMRGILGLG